MGLGQDKIAAEVFNIEPTAIVDLFRIYPDIVNYPNTYFNVHNGSVFGIGISWQGEDYMPIAMEYEGFEVTSDGRPNRPILRFSNSQYFASSLLDKYDDFSNGRIERKRTFVKFLDDVNFDGGNPWGESDSFAEISSDIYIVSQKKRENKNFVEVELTNPLDLEGFEVNHRRVLGKYCYWKYRGPGCQYQGEPKERLDRQPFLDQNNNKVSAWKAAKTNNTSYLGGDFTYGKAGDVFRPTKRYYEGNIVYKINDRVRIQDEEDPNSFYPLLVYYVCKASAISGQNCIGKEPNLHPEYWDKDGCAKTLSACKSRFKDIRQVQVGTSSKKYDQNALQTLEAKLTHMSLFAPNAGLESVFNWSYGDNFAKGRGKEFTMVIHLPRTYGYENLHSYIETPEYANIFASDCRSSNNAFRLSFHQQSGYGDLVINCLERVNSTTSRRVEYWPLRAGGVKEGTSFVEAQDINLQSCEDLLITIKMKRRGTTYKKIFDVEVSGINTGVMTELDENDKEVQIIGTRGEKKSFNIKNSFDTDAVLRSKPRRLVFLGAGTRRNNITGANNNKLLNWSHNRCTFGSVIIWSKEVANSIINKALALRVYNDQLKTPVIRRFSDLSNITAEKEAVLNGCAAYWQGTNSSGLVDRINNNTLAFKSSLTDKVAFAGSSFFDRTNWTKPQVLDINYSKDIVISNISAEFDSTDEVPANLGILPFGGFPGTDGYSFRSEP